MNRPSLVVLVVLGLALHPRSAHAKEPDPYPAEKLRAPYVEAAFGLGFFTLKAKLDNAVNDDSDFGTLLMGDLRVFLAQTHGLGLRLNGLSGVSLFSDAPGSGGFLLDAIYAMRPSPEKGFHAVPSLMIGPSYFHYSAPPLDCEPVCDEPELDSHHAFGAVAGLSLDFHGGAPFGGLEVNGRYLFPIASTAASEWMFQLLLRFGGTFPLRKQDDTKAAPPPERWR